MTDPDLVHRAEQAYLGAYLSRYGPSGAGAAAGGPGQPREMRAEDFADPVHQAVFAALVGHAGSTRPGGSAGWPGRLRDLLERVLSRQARAAAAYMTRLPGLCPDPANLAAYAAMITEASQDRADQAHARQAEQAASEDPTLAGAGAWLDSTRTAAQPVGRRRAAQAHPAATPRMAPPAQAAAPETPAPGRDGTDADLAQDVARLARALRVSAQRAVRRQPDRQDHAERSAERGTPAGLVTSDQGQPVPATPEDLERRVLASLMRHPGQGRAVTRWLPAEAFAAAPHRDLYDLIRQRLVSGRAVDPLIIAWGACRLPDTASTMGDGGPAYLAQTALQVGAFAPAPGTADVIGRALWADRLLTTTLGKDWPTEPGHASRLLATLTPDDPGEQPAPVPADRWVVRPQQHPEAGQPPVRHP